MSGRLMLSPADSEAFAAIVRHVRSAELRRERVLLFLAALSTVAACATLVLSVGWGWWPVASFASTFIPGLLIAYVIFDRRARGVERSAEPPIEQVSG